MKIALITDNKHRILQGTTMYQSLNSEYIINNLSQEFDLDVLTHHQAQLQTFDDYDHVIITSSQVYWYKQYVELTTSFINKHKLIPSIESLLSHENKAYEYLWLNQNYDHALGFKMYSQKSTFTSDNNTYPLVLKSLNGSSSRGVKICDNQKKASKFINKLARKQLISELLMTPPIQWAHHIRETKDNALFLTQECITNYEGDFRVQVMGDRFFVYYRQLKKNSKYTSGSGSVNVYDLDIDNQLLEVALQLQAKIKSPHIIFDLVLVDGIVRVLEFSAIHTSNVALDNCSSYYTKQDGKWIKKTNNGFLREDHYIHAYKWAIEKE